MANRGTLVVVLDDWNGLYSTSSAFEGIAGVRTVVHRDHVGGSDLLDRCLGAEVLVLNRERTVLDAGLIEALPDLRLIIQTSTVSPSSVDVASATRSGVAVAAAPGIPHSIHGVAELAFGLLIAVARRIIQMDVAMRRGVWNVEPTTLLSGGTAGIIGLGRLGNALAMRCAAFGMHPIAWGPTLSAGRAQAAGVEFVELEALFDRSDAVFVCVRQSERTAGLVNADLLGRLPATSYLINTARGAVVDEEALVRMLSTGRLAGAGLDVFGEEPLPIDHPLLTLSNVVLTPHIGWVTETNGRRFVESTVQVITEFMAGNLASVANPGFIEARR